MSALIFIDTNIYLDFYRASGIDTTLSILGRIDSNRERIITTSEVEMEYKKNRQKVILDCLNSLKPLDSGLLVVPAFLKESKGNKALAKSHKSLKQQAQKLRERTAKLLESPARNDPVYRVLQRLFKSRVACHLTRREKTKRIIRREARQRFMLGYPPRKRDEISLVDAVNWEWIVYCAQNCNDDIIVVSRDADFGCTYNDKCILNDWLLQEFKERVSHKRSITLTNRLTEAFKKASITVSKEEEDSEQSMIEAIRSLPSDAIWRNADPSRLAFVADEINTLKTMDPALLRSVVSEVLSEMDSPSAAATKVLSRPDSPRRAAATEVSRPNPPD